MNSLQKLSKNYHHFSYEYVRQESSFVKTQNRIDSLNDKLAEKEEQLETKLDTMLENLELLKKQKSAIQSFQTRMTDVHLYRVPGINHRRDYRKAKAKFTRKFEVKETITIEFQ